MDTPGQASPTSRMRLAAERPAVGSPRDPLPQGIDVAPLLDAIDAIHQRLDPPAGTGGRAAIRRGVNKVFRGSAGRDAALFAALESIVEATMSLNHLLGNQSALLTEHEERLRAAEVRAQEAELRAPLPHTT